MEARCPVAEFIAHRIEVTGKPQKDIAREVGFESPNVMTMIKQGHTKLPLAKIGLMASALETDPIALLKLCLSTYFPENWVKMEPLFESALTKDELVMVRAWREYIGAPYLAALTDEQKKRLGHFLSSLKVPEPVH